MKTQTDLRQIITHYASHIAFLEEHTDEVVDAWIREVRINVAPGMSLEDKATRDFLRGAWENCMAAAFGSGGRSFHFRGLTNYLLDTDYSRLQFSMSEMKQALFMFDKVLQDFLLREYAGDDLDGLMNVVAGFKEQMVKSVNQKLSEPLLRVLQSKRDELVSRWVDYLIVAEPHFTVLKDEADRPKAFSSLKTFVEANFDLYTDLLVGDASGLEEFSRTTVNTFESMAFDLSEVYPALTYIWTLADPLVHQQCGADPKRYRQATSQLIDALNQVCRRVCDDFDSTRVRDIHEGFENLFHQIKNKIAAIPAPLESLLGYDETGEQTMPPWLIIGDQLNVLRDLLQNYEGLLAAAKKANSEEIAAAAAELDAFREANAETIGIIEENVQDYQAEIVDEFLQDMVYQGARYTTELIRELHEKQKMLIEREKPTYEAVDLVELTDDAYRFFEGETRSKGLSYNLEIEVSEANVWGLEEDLRRVVRQNIQNAIKYTPSGSITVKLNRNNGDIMLDIIDTGIGISAADQENLFDLFHRSEQARQINPMGSGTGLYEDRKTVRAHGGEMWLESEGEGKGTTCHVVLPAYEPEQ